jgi:peroxiredoxin
MNHLHQVYAKDGLVVIGVNVDKQPELAQAFLRDTPASFRLANDIEGSLATQFDLQAMPTSFLIDRQGRIRQRHNGFRSEQKTGREQQILALLKETAQ